MSTALRSIVMALACILVSAAQAFGQLPLGTGFVYQGRLEHAGAALDGSGDFQFRLFSAATAGTQIGATQAVPDVPIVDGLFTVTLDFGAGPLNGDARWLEIAVRRLDSDPYTTLSPRQPLAGTPYALQTRGLFVNADRHVGVGTTAPESKLHVQTQTSGLALIQAHALNGNNTNFEMRKIGAIAPDNVSFGLSHRSNATEAWMYGYDGGTFRNFQGWDFAANRVRFPVSGSTLTLDLSSDRVGVGTSTPTARLDVRGDVRLGPAGQYFAPAGNENLRIIRGLVDGAGNELQGSGFISTRLATGRYEIVFLTAFAGIPSITATPYMSSLNDDRYAQIFLPTVDSAQVILNNEFDVPTDATFSFIVVGTR